MGSKIITMINKGTVTAIKGNVVEVHFPGIPPAMNDILVLKEDPKVRLEVYSSVCLLYTSRLGLMCLLQLHFQVFQGLLSLMP